MHGVVRWEILVPILMHKVMYIICIKPLLNCGCYSTLSRFLWIQHPIFSSWTAKWYQTASIITDINLLRVLYVQWQTRVCFETPSYPGNKKCSDGVGGEFDDINEGDEHHSIGFGASRWPVLVTFDLWKITRNRSTCCNMGLWMAMETSWINIPISVCVHAYVCMCLWTKDIQC